MDGLNVIYFTFNGNWIGQVPSDINGIKLSYTGAWYAAFSSSSPCIVKINIGQEPFLFNISIGELPFKDICTNSPPTTLAMEPNYLSKGRDPFQMPIIAMNLVNFPDNGREIARMVMSNAPISQISNPDSESFYFEVEILEQGPGINSFMAIGLCSKPYNIFHQIGWNRHSIGFHRYVFET